MYRKLSIYHIAGLCFLILLMFISVATYYVWNEDRKAVTVGVEESNLNVQLANVLADLQSMDESVGELVYAPAHDRVTSWDRFMELNAGAQENLTELMEILAGRSYYYAYDIRNMLDTYDRRFQAYYAMLERDTAMVYVRSERNSLKALNGYIRDELGMAITYNLSQSKENIVQALDKLNAAKDRILLLGAVSMLICGAVMLLLTRLIVNPIHRLLGHVDRFRATGEQERIEDIRAAWNEVYTLVESFDSMMDEIAQKQENDRRFAQLEINNARIQRELERVNLDLLQAQINPHFLYNTLDSIAILAQSQREEDVVAMVTSLSAFFRNSLSRGEDIITLRAERTQVTSYLEIQQIRYSDILNYEIDIPEALLDCLVPKLILQPLVENALYHGIKNRRGMGAITVTGEASGGDLLLRVRDNGAGMTPEQVQALQSGIYDDRHTGLGLVNVHKRIRLYCGERYGLSFESALGQGTTVTILLPQVREAASREGKRL